MKFVAEWMEADWRRVNGGATWDVPPDDEGVEAGGSEAYWLYRAWHVADWEFRVAVALGSLALCRCIRDRSQVSSADIIVVVREELLGRSDRLAFGDVPIADLVRRAVESAIDASKSAAANRGWP